MGYIRQVPCAGELCGVRVIPAVNVAVVQVKGSASLPGLGARQRRGGGNSGRLHGGWQTAVVFVADALGGWLVGQLAGAGRKNLLAVSTW